MLSEELREISANQLARTSLENLGVPASILVDIPDLGGLDALMVYGSWARGDAIGSSDLDLLGLVRSPKPSIRSGEVYLSYYSAEQLTSGMGTLFSAHLKRDGKILFDGSGRLGEALDSLGPVDTDLVYARALRLSQLFTTPSLDLPRYLPGLLRQARYLLRSCLYASAIAQGRPCFSVRELALRHDAPDLTRLLGSRQSGVSSATDYAECLDRLQRLIGPFPDSEHGSLEATIVNEWGQGGDLLSMALLALGASVVDFNDYAEVEKVLL